MRKSAGRRYASLWLLRNTGGYLFAVCGAWHTLAEQMYAWGKLLRDRVGEVQAKAAPMFA